MTDELSTELDTRAALFIELDAALDELVSAVEATAHPQITKPSLAARRRIAEKLQWSDDAWLAHKAAQREDRESPDVIEVENAADHIEERLEH